MKKRIFNLILVSFLILSVLFVLTACGDDDDKDKDKNVDNSTPEETIESFIDAVNDHDTSTMLELIDLDALESTFGEYYNKKEFKSGVKEFFEDNEDFEISSSKITSLEDDDELMESLLSVYDSYDEYVEEIEDEYDLDNQNNKLRNRQSLKSTDRNYRGERDEDEVEENDDEDSMNNDNIRHTKHKESSERKHKNRRSNGRTSD